MIKRILLPLDKSNYTDIALEYASLIAKKHKAVVNGITILDIPAIEDSIGLVPIGNQYWADKLEESKINKANTLISNLKKKFEDKLTKENVEYNFEKDQGIPSEWIIKKSGFYDLVIMGMNTYYHFNSKDKSGNTIKEVLNNSITPILLVTEKFFDIKNVLIAYDGSFQSTRAMQRFIHLSMLFDFNIKIINSSKNKIFANYQKENVESYFKAYDLQNIEFIHTEENIKDILNEKYLEWTDLIVLGAHSKNVIQDFFLGSLTSFLIDLNKKPLFIGF